MRVQGEIYRVAGKKLPLQFLVQKICRGPVVLES